MILLDTHILVWLLIAPENLSPKAKKAILAARKSGPLALLRSAFGKLHGWQ